MLNLTIGITQADLTWKDKQANFKKFENWLENNREQTDLVVLPEMFATGFVTEPAEVAENMQGATLSWMKEQAIKHQLAITGSVVIEENGKYFNRLFWVTRHGDCSFYDKRHLFTFGGEHKKFTSGNSKLIVNLNNWKICPLVCYDLRFPVWAKNTCNKGEYAYDVLIYIANWPSVRAHAFRQLLTARAIENQCYVVGVNRVGIDGNGLYYQGNTTIIDYNGNHITELKPDTELLEVNSLSYENLQKARENFPVSNDWDRFEIKED